MQSIPAFYLFSAERVKEVVTWYWATRHVPVLYLLAKPHISLLGFHTHAIRQVHDTAEGAIHRPSQPKRLHQDRGWEISEPLEPLTEVKTAGAVLSRLPRILSNTSGLKPCGIQDSAASS